MKKGKSKAEEDKKDAIHRVKAAIAKYKESETISELGIEAKHLSEKLGDISVVDAKAYLYAKHQRDKRKEKFVRARNTLLRIWTKLQTFAERYEQTQQQSTKKDKEGKRDKSELTDYADNIMKRWDIK